MTRLVHLGFGVLLACAGAALMGCGPDYERMEISGVVTPSGLHGEVSRSRIVVPHGMVVKAHIVPINDDDEAMPTQVRSGDPSILDVSGVVTAHDYAFLGKRPGTTRVEILADGDKVLVVEAIVTEQPAP